jgi:hypothetical protein
MPDISYTYAYKKVSLYEYVIYKYSCENKVNETNIDKCKSNSCKLYSLLNFNNLYNQKCKLEEIKVIKV